MDFEKRLEKAIERGHRAAASKRDAAARQAMSEEEYKRLHSQLRLEVSEYIEDCLRKLAHHFPGFRVESVVGDRGWGAAASRDNVELRGGSRKNMFNHYEIVIRPYSTAHVLDLAARGTINNRELLNRSQYQKLDEADTSVLFELIDQWTLEYAELYATQE